MTIMTQARQLAIAWFENNYPGVAWSVPYDVFEHDSGAECNGYAHHTDADGSLWCFQAFDDGLDEEDVW